MKVIKKIGLEILLLLALCACSCIVMYLFQLLPFIELNVLADGISSGIFARIILLIWQKIAKKQEKKD